MGLQVIVRPIPVISLEDAKAHLVIEHFDHDVLITALIDTAMQWLDGPNGWLGRAISLQTLEWTPDWWDVWVSYATPLALPCQPASSIVSVTYLDTTGAPQTLAPSDYRLIGDRYFAMAYGVPAPGVRNAMDAVKIRYEAGYAEDQLPAPIRHAMLLLIGQWYRGAGREAASDKQQVELPFSVSALLQPYRVWS